MSLSRGKEIGFKPTFDYELGGWKRTEMQIGGDVESRIAKSCPCKEREIRSEQWFEIKKKKEAIDSR